MIYDKHLTALLAEAAEKAFTSLFSEHPERFYYCSLITNEGYPPFICACSEESLKRTLEVNGQEEDARLDFKWSYADSPYCAYGYDEYFTAVKECMGEWDIFAIEADEEFEAAYEKLLASMTEAMRILDEKGLFGTGTERCRIFINAEVMPPDYTNVNRARQLNPPEAMTQWLDEAAEPEE